MGPVENATRVIDKASVSIHKSTRKKIAARRSCSGCVHLLNVQIDARIAEQRTDQL